MGKRVKAVVRVTLDIEDDSVWGAACTLQQVAEQAENGIRGLLTNGNELALKTLNRRIKSMETVEVRVFEVKDR